MTIKLHATLLGTYLFISLIGHQRWSKYIGEVVVVIVGGRLVGWFYPITFHHNWRKEKFGKCSDAAAAAAAGKSVVGS